MLHSGYLSKVQQERERDKMKRAKRISALVLSVILVLGSLTGCGKSDEKMLETVVSSVNEAKNFEMEAKTTGKMIIKDGGEPQEMDLSSSNKTICHMNPYKAKSVATGSSMGQSISSESYVQEENGTYVIYVKAADTWTKMELDGMEEAMRMAGTDMARQFDTDMTKYVKKEDRTEGNKTYLVYDYTVSGEEIAQMADSMTNLLTSMLGSNPGINTEEMMNKMLSEVGNITMTLFIDRQTESISRVEYSMTDMMNKMLKIALDEMKKAMPKKKSDNTMDFQEALASVELSVADMNMIMTYTNVGTAPEVTVPEEALKAKSLNELVSGSGMEQVQ